MYTISRRPSTVSQRTIQQSEEEREEAALNERRRLLKIYLICGALLSLGYFQLILIKFVPHDLGDSLPLSSYMWLVISLVCMMLMVFTELFNKFPINLMLALICVECLTLCALCYHWYQLARLDAMGILVLSLITSAVLCLMGAKLPLKMLPNNFVMLIITIVFIIVYIFLNIFIYAFSKPKIMLFVDGWSMLFSIPLTLYTTTLVHQRRVASLLSDEYILSSTFLSSFNLYMVHLIASFVKWIYDWI
ncbi:uncharacterized protein LOC108601432 [Drosophila busckii]|uniref:uncharacterized protein LOC108601432 n=1 Tax=Drosophila busckii TaxID=30019 RepID=UPI00083EEBF0|nr:uncharacterized protein LOC108601432 [Drosophila busckii]